MNDITEEAPGADEPYPGLHGRRVGKPLTAYQRELMDTLLPRLRIDLDQPVVTSNLFPPECSRIWLEIGFGGGDHLVAAAAAHPTIGFIGCEPFRNGVAQTLSAIAIAGLKNIRLHDGDVSDLLEALPTASLDRCFVFYPDPWPKRRQRKRRLMTDGTLSRLARVTRPGAELRFATDIDDYCGWMLARLLRSTDFAWTAQTAADWQQPWPNWVGTRYEAKAIDQGRRGAYLTARRR